ncbi:Hypothetical protein Nlim_1310 [Candidatus Nitrosarchaeum limnium SFB1]|jgi:hypothetical protein|uniref:Uncharacterized protein n=1 Tax=Candidatus Nitrosarchaeum limnium SFB1 TaxID=886738 RepID=F3KLD0_9ARCH|nr:Hypothetical protein Nlim_1310 [Candidatus Nitrosarchaeum limnium SFB1]
MLTLAGNQFSVKCAIMRAIGFVIHWNFFHAVVMTSLSTKPTNFLSITGSTGFHTIDTIFAGKKLLGCLDKC